LIQNKVGSQEFEVGLLVDESRETFRLFSLSLEDSDSIQKNVGMGMDIHFACQFEHLWQASGVVIVAMTQEGFPQAS
jgi:hypothetical protein